LKDYCSGDECGPNERLFNSKLSSELILVYLIGWSSCDANC